MRIGGLASGMDTDKIIADLMKASRIPLDKITQKKQYMQWQLDDYRSINRNLKTTSDKVFDTVMKQSTFNAKTVTVSNPDAVSIQNKNSTSDFTGTISVEKLATQASLQSEKFGPITGATKLSDIIKDGKTNFVIEAIDKDGKMQKTTIEFDISKDTLDSFLEKIGKQSDVTAFYDSHSEQVAMTSKNTGTSTIILSDDLKKVLNMEKKTVGESTFKETNGTNAEFTFNGLKTERPSNSFDINGVNITLKQVTTSNVTFSSAPDTDKVVDAVTQFVNDYNKMIEELNAKIREPKYRSFQPLSDEQKKDMKENEIKLWDEKAMSGTLRNDPEISSMLTKLRTMMSSTVKASDGTELTMKDLGITPSKAYTENGKLTIDETKLRKAISENPNNVYELFAKPATEKDGVDQTGTGGLARQFRSIIDDSRKVISAKAGSVGSVNDTFTMGRTMKELNKSIERFEDRLKMTESRLWKQFNAMENAIQRANAQSASLMSALGGG